MPAMIKIGLDRDAEEKFVSSAILKIYPAAFRAACSSSNAVTTPIGFAATAVAAGAPVSDLSLGPTAYSVVGAPARGPVTALTTAPVGTIYASLLNRFATP